MAGRRDATDTFGGRVITLLVDREMTVDQLAGLCGIAPRRMRLYLFGWGSCPRSNELQAIACALGVSEATLLRNLE